MQAYISTSGSVTVSPKMQLHLFQFDTCCKQDGWIATMARSAACPQYKELTDSPYASPKLLELSR
jgi:hypothetical protein